MTIGEWIDHRERPVPAAFRSRLNGDGPISTASFLAAADVEIRAFAERSPRDRAAAFSLLAADAYITYACLQALLEGGGSKALQEITRRIAQSWAGDRT